MPRPERPAAAVLARLIEQGLSIATAESLTGGLVSVALTELPGSSQAFVGGVVCYATSAKADVLHVPRGLLAELGPVHSATAAAMARHVRTLFGSDVGVATTGVAGPDPQDGVPPGRVYVAVDLHGGPAPVRRLDLAGDRAEVRARSVEAALGLLLEVLVDRAAASPAAESGPRPE